MAKKKEFIYDVFISYSHQNQDWVKNTLLAKLEQGGLKVFIDYRDFEIGESAPDAMERAVTTSKQTIIVLSPAYLKSNWGKFENLMLQVMDPANQKRQLIPILLEKCKIPLRLSTFTYADFTKPEGVDLAWQKLFLALKVPTPAQETPIAVPSVPHDPSHWHLAHPYPMPPNFTGRIAERTMLSKWLNEDTENRLVIVRALGGFGKSALSWQWLTHDVDIKEYPKVLWWSFYEGDASFEHFIEETLKYLKLEVPQGPRPQVDELLKAMQGQKILLIMDGFERALRAYSSMNAAYQGDEEPKLEENQLDCVNINAEIFLKGVCSLPSMKSKILITTRLTPRAVKPRGEFLLGCHEVELTAMQKTDAVEFFHKQKIKGTHAEIEAACAPYGYHPLSLCLLAGRILKDFENSADIVVAQKLKIDGDIKQHQHHVLEISYNNLPSHKQKLLSTIACFRSAVEHKSLESIVENKDTLDYDLRDLVERGLLHFDNKNKKFDLHPIVRRYTYERLTAPDLTAAHARLREYFVAVDVPANPQTLDDLAPLIELYYHTVQAGELDVAMDFFYERINEPTYYQFAANELRIELLRALFPYGEDKTPRLQDEYAQAWTLNSLANSYSASGQPRRAISLFEMANDIHEKKTKNKEYLAVGLGNAADDQLKIGALRAAESNLRRSIELSREVSDTNHEAYVGFNLGRTLSYRGVWKDAEQELSLARDIYKKIANIRGQGIIWVFSALRALLIARDAAKSSIENRKLSIELAQRALELAEEVARVEHPYPRDIERADWLLGAAYRINGQLSLAEHHLSEALTRCRAVNMVEMEADNLLDFARLRYDQKNFEEAKSLADEALSITERCGYVLQGADVNLFLAQYALEQEKDKAKAKEYAETALKLAHCDDGPPYHYKVAYEEAERMLEEL
jgi:tetratricopeptide (TPR) repeat protein